jgi:DNA-binding transcriptional LysR family regulator
MSALDWNNLKYFLAVARTGGLTPAAASLRTSASTVSRNIDAMEAALGVRLFLRQQRGYVLTDAGSTLFEQVAEVENAMHAVERHGAATGEIAGEVKLAAPESVAHCLITPQLPAFAARHPQLQVELIVSRQLADLSRREADIALRIVRPERQEHGPDYIAHEVGRFRFGLYCTAPALAAAGDWRALPHVSWDAAWVKLPMVDWLSKLFPGQAPVLRSNSMQTHYLAARSGLGAALLPRFWGDADPVLTRVEVDLAHTGSELWLLYHRDQKGSQRVLALRDFVMETGREALARYG